jgi:hypothetical protein
MNIDAIKKKLSALNNTGGERERIDYDAIFWRPVVGKHQVRIVTSKYNPEFPFSELKFHYRITKFPMIALSNFGKQDPIEDFVKELRKTSDKENWSLSGKIEPRTRIFAPIIVRGEEAKGVRLWGFGVNIYKALLALAEDEDIGDYTDPVNGYDLIVEQVAGNPYPTTTVRLKPKMSPLSTDAAQAEKWLKEQPNPLESFTQYDYDFIKNKLQAFLTPGSEESAAPALPGEPEVEAAPKAPATQPQASFEIETPTAKPTTAKAVTSFDDLFN